MDNENENKMVICDNLVKIYKTIDIEVVALQGLDLEVGKGEFIAVIGNSGSGKSTLMNMIGGLDRPSAGKLVVDGKNLLKMNDARLMKYKRETVGFVWQNNARNLIPYLTSVENTELPMVFSRKMKNKSTRERAIELLDMVGLLHRKNSKLSQLSGGEQQRVAIAIALSNNPSLLLADEPTGSVDTKTASIIMDVLKELNRNLTLTIIIVTHDRDLSRKVNRVVAIRDGRTSSEFIRNESYVEEIEKINEEKHDSKQQEDSHVELAVVDRAGRLQIPREYLDSLGLKGRSNVLVEYEEGRIVLLPWKQKHG